MNPLVKCIYRLQTRCAANGFTQTQFRSLTCRVQRTKRNPAVLVRSFNMSAEKPVTLYTAGTPNGWKPTAVLEELNVPYKLESISIMKGEQKAEPFLKINPNGRIPALVDHDRGDFPVFESGAIMMYLCDRFDTEGVLLPKDLTERYEVIEWLMFQMGGVGPMQGQANHFVLFTSEKIEYAQQRYLNETKRLYSVLEKQLEGKEWLAAGKYTLADIANYCWVAWSPFLDIDLSEFPNVKAWVDRIQSRDAILQAMDIPEPWPYKAHLGDPKAMKALFTERMSR